MKYILSLLFSSLLVLCVACSDDNSNPSTPQSAPQLMPLSVHNEWHYRFERWIDGAIDTTAHYVTRIDSSYTEDGVQWYATQGQTRYRLGAEGLYEVVNQMQYLYKYPVEPGEEFYWYKDDFLTGIAKVISTDTVLSVAAGSFQCIHYQITFYSSLIDVYYSPGVGRVRWEDNSPNQSEHILLELESYSFPDG